MIIWGTCSETEPEITVRAILLLALDNPEPNTCTSTTFPKSMFGHNLSWVWYLNMVYLPTCQGSSDPSNWGGPRFSGKPILIPYLQHIGMGWTWGRSAPPFLLLHATTSSILEGFYCFVLSVESCFSANVFRWIHHIARICRCFRKEVTILLKKSSYVLP